MRLINKPGKHPCIFCVDELASLYIPGLTDFLSTARSNRIAAFLGFQDFSQLEERYGKTGSSTILANCVHQIYGMNTSDESARAIAGMFGVYERGYQTKGRSGSAGLIGPTRAQQSVSDQVDLRHPRIGDTTDVKGLSPGCFYSIHPGKRFPAGAGAGASLPHDRGSRLRRFIPAHSGRSGGGLPDDFAGGGRAHREKRKAVTDFALYLHWCADGPGGVSLIACFLFPLFFKSTMRQTHTAMPFLFALLALLLALPNQNLLAQTTHPFAAVDGTNGTAEYPYQITTIAHLNAIRGNFLDDHFVLTKDLDFLDTDERGADYVYSTASGTENAKGWLPIGHDTVHGDGRDVFTHFQGTPFSGSFDGDGHVILNLLISRSDEEFVGLFGVAGTGGL